MKNVAKVHSPLGASSMERWSKCPGSVRLSQGIPPRSSRYADEGTAAHELAEAILRSALKGQEYAAEDVDPETLEHVMVYVDEVLRLSKLGKVHLEHRFDLSSVYPGCFGTCDAIVVDEKRGTLYVIDYKHGAGIPVEVERNPQLLFYGLGGYISTKAKVRTIELKIVQPRCNHSDGPIRQWSCEAEELLDFAIELIDFAKATEDPKAALVPGDHCRFCPANGICPEVKNKAQVLAKQVFNDELSAYDPRELSKTLAYLPMIEAWTKSVKEFAYSEAVAGRIPPGWKIVAKRAIRKWKDEKLAAVYINGQFTAPVVRECFDREPRLKSIVQIEKVIHEKQLTKMVEEGLIVKESSGTVLVEETDKRPAAKALEAKDAFEEIDIGEGE